MSVRWGVIGYGRLATRKMIPAIDAVEDAALAAVATRTQSKLDELAQQRPGISTYSDWRELLADPNIDAVYIGTPNNLHAEMTLEAAARGKHVLCDKPMALNTAEAVKMVEACDRAGVTFGLLYHAIFNGANRYAYDAIHAEKLGTLRFIRGRFSFSYGSQPPAGEWRLDAAQSGGGPLVDIGIYPLYMLRRITGHRVRRVSAMAWSQHYKAFDVPDTTAAWFELENGTPGTLDTSYTVADTSRLEIDGDEARLEVLGSFTMEPAGKANLITRSGNAVRTENFEVQPARLHHADSYMQLVRHFQESMASGSEPLNSARAALAEQRTIDAIHRSAEQGGAPVDVEHE